MYQQMLAERGRLENELQSIQTQLKKFPDGKLICTRNGKYAKWYQSDGKKYQYIHKDKQSFAEQLAIKYFWTTRMEELQHEIMAIDFYLRHHSPDFGESEKIFTERFGYSELLSPFFQSHSSKISQWINAPYEQNTKYPESLNVPATSGKFVRSKSEALIDYILYTNKIPFRYECALPLGDTVIYPDFTVMNPRTEKIYYWDHFGMMDKLSYRQNASSKLQLYISHGIIPSIDLITTFETKQHPLSAKVIEDVVKNYFL